eukprot:Nk52_evm1s2340 gene=Nk52_evmTU1s2340
MSSPGPPRGRHSAEIAKLASTSQQLNSSDEESDVSVTNVNIQPDTDSVYRLLRVKVLSARNLTGKSRGGLSDPYVVLKLGTRKAKTSVIEKCLNPTWNEEFVFYVHRQATESLKISVWDYDFGKKDDFLGMIKIPVQHVPVRKIIQETGKGVNDECDEKFYKLEKRTVRSNVTGEVCVDICFLEPEKKISNSIGAANSADENTRPSQKPSASPRAPNKGRVPKISGSSLDDDGPRSSGGSLDIPRLGGQDKDSDWEQVSVHSLQMISDIEGPYQLTCRIFGGRSLKSSGDDSKMFVSLKTLTQKCKTSSVRSSKCPTWEEDFCLGISSPAKDFLKVKLCEISANKSSPTILGTLKIPISRIPVDLEDDDDESGTLNREAAWYGLQKKTPLSATAAYGDLKIALFMKHIRENNVSDAGFESGAEEEPFEEDESIPWPDAPVESTPDGPLPVEVACETFPCSISKLHSLLYSENSACMSDVFQRRRLTDIEVGPWEQNEENKKSRKVSYTIPLDGPIGPKSASNQETQTFTYEQPKHYFVIDNVASTPNVPYGTYFETRVRNELMYLSPKSTKYRITSKIVWNKSTMMKGTIEKAGHKGMKESMEHLFAAIRKSLAPKKAKVSVDDNDPSLIDPDVIRKALENAENGPERKIIWLIIALIFLICVLLFLNAFLFYRMQRAMDDINYLAYVNSKLMDEGLLAADKAAYSENGLHNMKIARGVQSRLKEALEKKLAEGNTEL